VILSSPDGSAQGWASPRRASTSSPLSSTSARTDSTFPRRVRPAHRQAKGPCCHAMHMCWCGGGLSRRHAACLRLAQARVLAAHACPCSGVMCVCQRIAMCAVLLRLLLVTTCACLRRVQRPAAAHRRDAHRVQQPAAGAPPQCSQAARPPCGLTLTASISCTAAAVSYRRSGRKQAPIQALQPAGASSVCHPTPILTLC